MNETPLPNNPMKPEGTKNRRKILTIAGIVTLAVVVLASVGYSIYAWQQSQQPQSTTENKSSQTTPKEEEKTPSPEAPSTDPYAGWLSATIKYEKVTLKYPSTWTLTNTGIPHSESDAVTPGYDKAKVVSPTGLTVTIDTGVSGIGGGPYGNRVFSATPITTLGGSYYLGFGAYGGESDLVLKGTIGTTSDKTAAWPSSKNISSLNGDTFNVISMAYLDGAGNAIEKRVSDFQGDASYNDALLIIQSLTY